MLPTHQPVSAVLASGSGASVVHRRLEAKLSGYRCWTYNPLLEYCPPLLMRLRRHSRKIMHVPPDQAILVTRDDSHLVVTFHSYFLDFPSRSSLIQRLHYRTDLRWLTRKAIKRAVRITSVSRYVADLVRDDLGFTGEVRVIPNGIDVARFSVVPRAHHNIRILYSGNLSKRKGADLLGPIAEKLDMGIELWIASGLKGRDYARQRSPNMKTLGSISYDEMPALYNQVDILVVPSLREGFCLVAAEAMACGLPVVASKCSAMPELIVEGESGFLVEPEDASGFADRLNHLASDNELRRRIGIYNRQRIVQHFNEETMVEGYADLFAELD